jgi:hypothetical protein
MTEKKNMKKAATSLENLIPSRIGSRATPAPAPTPANEEVQPKPRGRQAMNRGKLVMIAGHFDPDVSFAMHELCGKLTRQRGQRLTVQQALGEALADWFVKHGATPPDGLDSDK